MGGSAGISWPEQCSMKGIDFQTCVLTNPANSALLARLPALKLKECYLTAGCLFQAIWNKASGNSSDWGVKDYDVFYFDDNDLSWEAEDQVIHSVAHLVSDLGIRVEVRNQARVHLWYLERFGGHYPKLTSTRDGIDRFLISCTCVGIEVGTGDLYAPNGLDDLVRGILRMNSRNSRPNLFRQKAESYLARWPWLTVADENGEPRSFGCGVVRPP